MQEEHSNNLQKYPQNLPDLTQHHKNQQQLQIKHQNEILMTFINYSQLMKRTSPGRDLLLKQQQSKSTTKRIENVKYYQLLIEKKKEAFLHAVKCNQQFLNEIVNFCQGQERINSIEQAPITYNNFSKIKTTVKQFYREWSDQGQEVKDYAKIVDKAKKYLNKGDKVLAPGSGLGRLVLEFVEAGFGCQGNEVSYFMLYGSNFILNCVEQEKQYEIYPFISSTDYYYNEEDIFRSVRIPDKAACKVVGEDADFSMAAGQFTQVYSKMKQQFEGVATCFFIDTANNIFDYINIIHQTLKPNGIWINFGPLLFHYRQIYNQISIEVSWDVLKQYISDKFEFLQQQMQEASYCHDPKSEMGIKYDCIMFLCKKK